MCRASVFPVHLVIVGFLCVEQFLPFLFAGFPGVDFVFALRWLVPCPMLMLRVVGLGGVFYALSGNAFSRWLLSAISNFRWERPAESFFALFSQLVDASVFPAPLLLVGCCTHLGVFSSDWSDG